jgi:hypothetical protein
MKNLKKASYFRVKTESFSSVQKQGKKFLFPVFLFSMSLEVLARASGKEKCKMSKLERRQESNHFCQMI